MSENTNCFKMDIDFLRNYMINNNIDQNLDTNKPIKSLGIYKIDKLKKNIWTIHIKGPKHTIYKDGAFSITLDFRDSFPNQKPELRFVNKIYHLNVSPRDGHISTLLINYWRSDITISEILVGIYLFLALKQDTKSPYSGEMAREYENNFSEFVRKAKEWVWKYAQPSLEDINLIKEMKNSNSPEETISN